MKRWLRALAIALPALLLGAGWLAASLRERASRSREQETRLIGVAAAVRGAVDEGLESLRRGEDERPFYLYNHLYTPTDMLAVSDPIAVSPLASPARDPRVLGWFQVDPDGTVRTPFTAMPTDPAPPEAQRVIDVASSEALADLRALVAGSDALVAQGAPLPVMLNSYAVAQAADIQQAQSGDPLAFDRVTQRGRQAPVTVRQTVDLNGLQSSRRNARASVPDEPAARPPLVPPSTEVEYTPMEWRATGSLLVMTRVVSHDGGAVLQGVALDRAEVIVRWIPSVIARVAASEAPRVVTGPHVACAIRAPASAILDGVELCFAARPRETIDADIAWQIAALAALMLAVMAAAIAIERASRRAEALARERSAFVSAVSHELRTPLTTIRMHAEMLEEGMVDEARRPKVLRELVSESERLSRLVNDVIEISRLEAGRRPLRARRADLAAHVARVVADRERRASEAGFEIVTASDAPIEADFDAQAIDQIVVNLVDNALKYAAIGDGERTIEVRVEREGERAIIRVLDRGPGIPESERARVFERFHRVEQPETAHAPGTGIGLSLVRDLARSHGGDAEARAREGGGCEIRVWIAVRAPRPAQTDRA